MAEPPIPRGANDRTQIRHGRVPTQQGFCLRRIGNQSGGVAGARGFDLQANVASGDFARAFDDLQYRIAATRSQIEKIGLAARAEMFEGANVRIREVDDMDVVPDRRAIGSRVVVAKHTYGLLLSQGRGENIGNQMRFWPVVFPAIFSGASGVEVAQGHEFHSIGGVISVEEPFHEQLGPTVRIPWPFPALFRNRNLFRVAVDGGCGGKYETPHARLNELPNQRDSVPDVVLEILGWIDDGFPDFNQRGEMYAGFQGMLTGDARYKFPVANLSVIEGNVRRQSGPVAPRQIVQHHNLLSFCEQAFDGYAADVA